MSESASVMGRVDAIDVGERKLTVQTEFFPRPAPRLETKVYLGGALKKVYAEQVDAGETDLQHLLHRVHERRLEEIVSGLQGLRSK
ncbi:MAG TPA: hypothetical protein VMS56_05145 [Thermoanaerobaculia bacterium]|nr:hypothetical protein [Thermoanaerobaculia bacterium]